MNYKYLLLVFKNKTTESYYADDKDELIKYANFRNFIKYKIFELKEIKDGGINE